MEILLHAASLYHRLVTKAFIQTLLCLLLLSPIVTFAQNTDVATINSKLYGKVIDAVTKETLPGVLVKIKGTTHAVPTNTNGEFSFLTGQKFPYIVQVSYIGYEPLEFEITKSAVTIEIKPLVNQLNDVVVVGYGTQKRSSVIGSVAQVSAKQINDRPVTSLSNALTGQLPGVTVIQRSGQPGASGGEIQVRGVGSFGASPAAFILVDGIPVNSFDNIDPNDIENISVLKDASTAAIYGSRAANGVILVTTKSGKTSNGKININYNGYTGTQRATAYPKFVNSADYATLLNEAQPGAYTDAQIQKFRDGSDLDNYPNIDYAKAVFKKSTLQTGHNLSFSNSTQNTQYLVSLGYLYQNGIVQKNDYSRYNVRVNLTNSFTSKLKLTTHLYGAKYITNEPSAPSTLDFTDMLGIISNVIRVPSIYPYQLSNGDFGLGVVAKGTPLSYINNDSFYNDKQTDLLANTKLDWDVIKGLKLSMIAGYTELNDNNQRFLANQRLTSKLTLGPGSLTQRSGLNTYKTLQQLADYRTKIKDHEFGILAGHSYEYTGTSALSANRTGFNSNDLTQLDAGDASTQKNNGTAAEYALDSYFTRINYNFKGKYLIEGTIRYDGSSRFPSDNKYASFPAVAVGWRISEESFLKDRLSWLTDLKLKASYGKLGNQNIGNYSYQNVLTSGFNYPIGGTLSTGVANTTLNDPDIHWETTRTKDIGIDAGFLKGKLTVSASYFDRYTYDILVTPTASVSQVLGLKVGVQNSGKLSNKGWEFTAGYQDQVGDFSYGINGNLTIVKNKVLDLGVGNILQPNGLTGNGSTLFNNYPINVYYGYVADGLFKDAADVAAYANQTSVNPRVQAGDIRYKDISGPNGIPDGKVDATYDRTVLGSTIPKFTYGFNLTAGYKNFDFSILLQGASHVNGYLDTYAGWAFYNNGNIQQWMADDHWSTSNPNPNAKYPRLEVINNQGTANTLTSSFWMLNANYLKVRNIQLGYKFPNPLLQKMGLQNLRVSVTAQNPLSFNNYPKGWDPETNTNGSYYPILANYSFGLTASF
jgi:TonB-linked SusC/RagA family outer membrane protein